MSVRRVRQAIYYAPAHGRQGTTGFTPPHKHLPAQDYNRDQPLLTFSRLLDLWSWSRLRELFPDPINLGSRPWCTNSKKAVLMGSVKL